MKIVKRVQDLDVYRKAFDSAMEIFSITKTFPKEETYALSDQIRRSSRSICANLSEGWRKRKYRAAFRLKLIDASQEASETQTWLEFALACGYISNQEFIKLNEAYEHIFAMLATMQAKIHTFTSSSS